jgi:hypothetical protein
LELASPVSPTSQAQSFSASHLVDHNRGSSLISAQVCVPLGFPFVICERLGLLFSVVVEVPLSYPMFSEL